MTTDILSSNFFDLFNIPVSYEVDLDLIQQRYRELQKAIHPDNFVNASDQEKRISMQQTSWVNEALNTLKQPVERAIYLLKINNIDINLENETTMDKEFLMEQMEMREELSDVRSKKDPLVELDRIGLEIRNKMKVLDGDFSKAFTENEFDDAKELIRKMQFLQKSKKEVIDLSISIEEEM